MNHLHCQEYNNKTCQSCTWLEKPYANQLAEKQQQAAAALPVGVKWLEPVASTIGAFRNKAKMAAGGKAGTLKLGLQNRDGSVQDLTRCPLYAKAHQDALIVIRTWLDCLQIAPYSINDRKGELKYVLLSTNTLGQLMLRLVLRTTKSIPWIIQHLSVLTLQLPALVVISANIHPEHKAVLEGAEERFLSEQTMLPMPVGDLCLMLQPQSFFQTNTGMAEALYQRAANWLTTSPIPNAHVLDLYCGVGGFALFAAHALPQVQVLGIELSSQAVQCANAAAAKANLGNARFECADATQIQSSLSDSSFDTIIVNPPRRGLGVELCEWLNQSGAQQLIYSSCNLDSLVQDLGRLSHYQAVEAQLLDMFAHTSHFEVMVRLMRR